MAAPPSYEGVVADASYVKLSYGHEGLVQLSALTPTEGNVRTPIDLIVALDISGSMNSKVTGCPEMAGYTRIQLAQHALNVVLANFSASDYFTLITFNETARVAQTRLPLNEENVKYVRTVLEGLKCSGFTNLYDGLKTAYSYIQHNLLAQTAQQFINRHLMVLTDGYPNVDIEGVKATEFAPYQQLIERQSAACPVSKHTLVHCFGICYDQLDRQLLGQIARAGHGMYGFISDPTIITPCFINILAVWFNMWVTGLVLQQEGGKDTFVPWVLQSGVTELLISKSSLSFRLLSNTQRVMRLAVDVKQDEAQVPGGPRVPRDEAYPRYVIRQKIAADLLHAILNDVPTIVRDIRQALATTNDSTSRAWLEKLAYDVDVTKRIKAEALALWAPFCLHSLALSLQDDYVSNGYEKSYKTKTGPRLQYWVDHIERVAKNVVAPNPRYSAYEGDGGRAAVQPAPAAYVPRYRPRTPSPPRYRDYMYSGSGRDYDDGCIDGECWVEMADGSKKKVKDVTIGDRVMTDRLGTIGVIRCSLLLPSNKLVELPKGLRLTHMHPVWDFAQQKWIWPYQHKDQKTIVLEQPIDMYSFLLEPTVEPTSAMLIHEQWVAHFAHNNQDKVMAHDFYGTEKIRATVERLDPERKGRVRITKALRDEQDQVYDYEGVAY